MLRLQTNEGWWLVTHPEHARLAGEFASRWGNEVFAGPEPRAHVLRGIYAHDDGWAARDALPAVTRQCKPAAFSTELVGAYSAFEEIDLQAYLAVRREAVRGMAQEDEYAAILISMHTVNLLTDRADRSTIAEEQLPWLDAFLVEQLTLQRALREMLLERGDVDAVWLTAEALRENFRLLQACDNLSLLGCVDYAADATMLWPLAMRDGGVSEVIVKRLGERVFRLTPYPFVEDEITFGFAARFVKGAEFGSSEELQRAFAAAEVQRLEMVVTS
jgi:hypothetical protein